MSDRSSADRLKRAGDFFKRREYEKALEELDLLLKDEPNNMYARAAREKVRTTRDLAFELGASERTKDLEKKKMMAIETSQRTEHQQLLAKIEEEGQKRRNNEIQKKVEADQTRVNDERQHRYITALSEAWSDGMLTEIEAQHLAELREKLKIEPAIHDEFQPKVRLDAYVNALREACRSGQASISKPDTFEELRQRFGISFDEHMKVAGAIAWQLKVAETKGAVVVVDDDPLTLRIVRMNFEQVGYIVETFNDCEEALQFITEHRPDLVISDIVFTPPKINGFAFFEKIRQTPSLVPIPFITMSAMSDRPRIIAGMRLGIDDFFAKPLDFALLLASAEGKIRHFHELMKHHYT